MGSKEKYANLEGALIMSEALATKYRPKKFEDVVEQSSTITILKRQISTNTFSHTYLFQGTSGAGKTTAARIMADEINNHQGAPIEIDAASNNGVDNVRAIIKNAQERSIEGKYKIFIIDEAHALTSAAWQAFLKCLEEPPAYTIFIFCTTEPQKIPATILNRLQIFTFNRISAAGIKDRLQHICEQERFINYQDSIDYISRIAHGGMRDAISLLDKCSSLSTDLNIENVLRALGNYSYVSFFELLNALIDQKENKVLEIITNYYYSGNDLKVFVDQFLAFILDVNKYALFKTMSLLELPISMQKDLDNVVNIYEAPKYYAYLMDKVLGIKNQIKNETDIKSVIEVYFLQISRGV